MIISTLILKNISPSYSHFWRQFRLQCWTIFVYWYRQCSCKHPRWQPNANNQTILLKRKMNKKNKKSHFIKRMKVFLIFVLHKAKYVIRPLCNKCLHISAAVSSQYKERVLIVEFLEGGAFNFVKDWRKKSTSPSYLKFT